MKFTLLFTYSCTLKLTYSSGRRTIFLMTSLPPCIEAKPTARFQRSLLFIIFYDSFIFYVWSIYKFIFFFLFQEMVTVGVDSSVLERIAKIMSYLRLGSSGKVLKKKKKDKDSKGPYSHFWLLSVSYMMWIPTRYLGGINLMFWGGQETDGVDVRFWLC